MSCVASGRGAVRYENQQLSVMVVYDYQRSRELDLYIDRNQQGQHRDKPSFTLGEVLRLHDAKAPERIGVVTAESESDIASDVPRMSQLLQTYGAELLRNSSAEFLALEQLREREAKAYAARHSR
jgi:hypothetical protein